MKPTRSMLSTALFVIGVLFLAASLMGFLADGQLILGQANSNTSAARVKQIRRATLPPTPQATASAVPSSAAGSDVVPTAPPTATPTPTGPVQPDRMWIPAIGLDAPIKPATVETIHLAGKDLPQWKALDEFAVGWHTNSAWLGEPGNSVFNGHHNAFGEVFRDLVELQVGDKIYVYGGGTEFVYQITNRMIVAEKYEPLHVRLENARWLAPSQDERITLITCYPYETNTHRLILVAQPWPSVR